jgi:16S rRNA (guanine527-N7)-methyltransferase
VKQPLTAEAFFAENAVSRETADKLRVYAALLTKWQARINLVGPATLPDLWRRHFLDSAQLFPLLPAGPLLDFGSGAGFPGLVLAILRGDGGDAVHLVEADGRKCAFLREVARLTATPIVVHAQRIEDLSPFAVSAVTARALAPLAALLRLAAPFLQLRTECLFLKGEKLEDELTAAGKDWKMEVERIPSRSDPNGAILRLKEVYRGRDER